MRIDSETDWERVQHDSESDAPIVFNPEDELYDPNDGAAVREAWSSGIVTATRRGTDRVRVERVVKLQLPPEIVERYEMLGETGGLAWRKFCAGVSLESGAQFRLVRGRSPT